MTAVAGPRTTGEDRLPEYDQWAGRTPGPDEPEPSAYPVSSIKRRKTYGYRSGPGRRAAVVPPEMLEDRPRRWTEFAMPAAVILAGVLIVVAFGFIINHARHSGDDHQAAPAVQPPALGQFSDGPNQAAIPLPSESLSPSASPSPSKSPSPSPTKKPVTKPADVGSVALARSGIASLVDLSAEGKQDWVHWGEESTFSLERDKDGDFKILEGAPTAPRFRHGLSPQRFSWTGGSPVGHSDGTPTGIRTCGKGNGFTLSAPATTTTRTLRLYVGVLAGTGRLSAKLSTGGGTRTGTLTQPATTMSTAVFTITYRAPKNGTLKLDWTTTASFNSDCGGVALEAATLR
jgi:hypothetical protein